MTVIGHYNDAAVIVHKTLFDRFPTDYPSGWVMAQLFSRFNHSTFVIKMSCVITVMSPDWHCVSTQQHLACLFKSLFKLTNKKTSVQQNWPFLRRIYRSPVDSPQRGPSNAESVSMPWGLSIMIALYLGVYSIAVWFPEAESKNLMQTLSEESIPCHVVPERGERAAIISPGIRPEDWQICEDRGLSG